MSKLGEKNQIRACVFTLSVKLEKWISRRRFVENENEMHRNKKRTWRACKGFVFLKIKHAKFVALLLPSRRRS